MLPAEVPPGTLFVEQQRAALGQDDAVGVIFDASGSMLQRLDGVRRVEIARQTLAELVRESDYEIHWGDGRRTPAVVPPGGVGSRDAGTINESDVVLKAPCGSFVGFGLTLGGRVALQ